VDGVSVPLRPHIKYLGLNIDARWRFESHFRCLEPRLLSAADALSRLLPNIGGPSASVRRLYATIVRSMALYGAPVWADALSLRAKASLRRAQRTMALRAIRGYRTISWSAACALAGTPPWELVADLLAASYRLRCEERDSENRLVPRERNASLEEAREDMYRLWSEDLGQSDTSGTLARTLEAVRFVLRPWAERRHGSLTYHLVQVLSGHGSFGKYLHRIGREATPQCHHCGAEEDSAQHTLEVCPSFSARRAEMVAVIGGDLSLPIVVNSMLESEESWDAVNSFCVDAMTHKEAAERAREVDPLADPCRRRRPGRRRRQYARLLLPVRGQHGSSLGGSDHALHTPPPVVVDAPDALGHRQAPLGGAGGARPRRAVTAGAVEVSVRVPIASSRSGTPAPDASSSPEDVSMSEVVDVCAPR
jgi:hypothetical protein